MQTRRNLYITIGIALIVLNLLGNFANPDTTPAVESESFQIGYFLGSYLFSFVGVVFLFLASRQQKKLIAHKKYDLEKEIEGIGKN